MVWEEAELPEQSYSDKAGPVVEKIGRSPRAARGSLVPSLNGGEDRNTHVMCARVDKHQRIA